MSAAAQATAAELRAYAAWSREQARRVAAFCRDASGACRECGRKSGWHSARCVDGQTIALHAHASVERDELADRIASGTADGYDRERAIRWIGTYRAIVALHPHTRAAEVAS